MIQHESHHIFYLLMFILLFLVYFHITSFSIFRLKNYVLGLCSMFFVFVYYALLSSLSIIRKNVIDLNQNSLYQKISVTPESYFIGLIIFSIMMAYFVLRYIHQKNRNTITHFSIKESLDYLPMGLWFINEKNMTILINTKMETMCQKQEKLDHIQQKQWDQICDLKKNHQKNEITQQIHFKNNDIYQVKRRWIETLNMYEITCFDITKLVNLNNELEVKNQELKAMKQRLENYSFNLKEILKEEERLRSKTRIHDKMGYAILASRLYFTHNKLYENPQDILNLWKNALNLLKGNLLIPSIYQSLNQSAETLGINFITEGNIPKDKEVEKLLVSISAEVFINAIRHAQANTVYLKTYEHSDATFFEFSNDGKIPQEKIQEAGGLNNIRLQVEKHSGNFLIKQNPQLNLIIDIPKKRGDGYG